jgi:AcrR family transcriptional regulator
VVEAAVALFGEHGYDQVSMDEVAGIVGVSKPVVYDLVGSKDQLFRLAMTRQAAELATRVTQAAAAAAPDDRLRAAVEAFFAFVADHRAVWRRLMAQGAGPATAEIVAARRRQAEIVAELFGADIVEVAGIPDPAHAVATMANGALEALANWWLDHEGVTMTAVVDLSIALLTPGIAALAPPGGH